MCKHFPRLLHALALIASAPQTTQPKMPTELRSANLQTEASCGFPLGIKRRFHPSALIACVLLSAVLTPQARSQTTAPPMNEKLVITLLQIHTPESAILEIIQNPKNKFSFSYSQGNVKALNDAGVTPKIFFAMYNPAAQAPAPSVEPAATPAPGPLAANQQPANIGTVPPLAPNTPTPNQPSTQVSTNDALGAIANEGPKAPPPDQQPADPSTCKDPTTPVLSARPMKGNAKIAGNVQTTVNSCFHQVWVYVCSSVIKPSASKLDCSTDSSLLAINPTDPTASVIAVKAGQDGSFSAKLATPLAAGSYLYVTERATPTPPSNDGKPPTASDKNVQTASSTPIQVNPAFSYMPPLGVAAAGLDIEGAASVSASPVFLALGLVDLPLMNKGQDDPTKPKTNIADAHWWVGTDIRVSGMAQPGGLSGSDASEAALGGYLATALTANPDNIVKSIDSAAYLAVSPGWNWHPHIGTFDVGDYNTANLPNPETLVTLSLFASAGVITPLSASEAAPPVYDITSQVYQYLQKNLSNLPGSSAVPTTCQPGTTGSSQCYVSFIPADRSHFYRNYSAGFRFKFYPGDYDDNEYRFPGKADFTIGQNEYVTGGRMSRWVVHTGAVMPVPKLDGWYIFGSTDTQLTRNGPENAQLLLVTAPSTAALTYSSPSVYDVTVPEPNRDRYSIGFAVDLWHWYSAFQKKQKAVATLNTSQQ
jgi:hypothetical protein